MELVGTARNPVPTGAATGTFVGHNGVKVRYALWSRTGEQRRGTVCLFGGRKDFIEKYFETVTDLRRRGFSVAAMDWRGQGGSDRLLKNPRKCHIDDFSDYDKDLRQFMNEIVLADCPAPFFGLGHAMGAHILLRSAQTKMCWFDRLVLTSPMIDLEPQLMELSVHRFIIEAGMLLGLGDLFLPGGSSKLRETEQFDDAKPTSDKVRFERIQDLLNTTPQLGLGAPTIGWMHAASRSIMLINEPTFAAKLKVPLLIIAPSNDRMVSMRATERFASRVKGSHLVVVAGARHEILQERDTFRDQFWAAFDAYVPGSNRTMSAGHLGF